MTLDEGHHIEAEWQRIARITEAEDRAHARADWEERELIESPEAIEQRWREIFRAQAAHVGPVHYERTHG